MIDAVLTKNKAALQETLRAAYAKGTRGGTRPIVFRRGASGGVEAEIGPGR